MLRALCVIVLLNAIFWNDLSGSDPIAVNNLSQKIYVSEMDQYIDSSSSLTYYDFQFNNEQFYKAEKDLQGTRNKKFTYWMKFILEGDLLEDEINYLLCTDSRITHLEMWIDGVAQTEGPVGTKYLYKNRKINHRNLVFPLPQKKDLEVVVKIRSSHSTFFAFEVKAQNRFLSDSYWEAGVFGSVYGVIVLGLFFSLVMRLQFRDSIYTAFAVFALVAFVTCLFLDGSGFQFYWQEFPSVNFYLLVFLPVVLLFSSAGLVISVLEIWDRKNFYFRIIAGSLILSLIGYVFAFTIPQYFIHTIFYMIPYLVMIYCCIAMYRAGNRSVMVFIFGFVFIILANLLYMMQPYFSVEYYHWFIRFSPHFGVVALTLSLSYAQYQKFVFLSEYRKSERKKSIQRLEELNKMKDGINEEIAEKVAYQTEELESMNSIIHQQNAELQQANDKLKEQTDEIVILNLKLNQENQELKSDVEKINESRIMQSTIPFDDFKQYFNSDDSCYAMLEELKWQNGFECVKCGNTRYGKGKGERARRCTKCGANDSVTSNTIFHRIHFPLLKGFYILFLVNKHGDNLISKDLSEIVDLRLATCWKFSKKIKAKKLELEQSGKVIESWLNLI